MHFINEASLQLLLIIIQLEIAACFQLVARHLKPEASGLNGANIIAAGHNADSDLEDYTDQVYYELAAEYQDNLRSSAETEAKLRNRHSPAGQHYNDSGDTGDSTSKSERDEEGQMEESYEEMTSRLKCDNPWFWNAPKCTWLDVQAKNVIKRTQMNAKTSAWLIGSVSTLFISWICGMYCLYLFKMRNRERLLKLRKKYTPGRLELPSGKVVHYHPTQEEQDAYEELVKAIIVQEMALLI